MILPATWTLDLSLLDLNNAAKIAGLTHTGRNMRYVSISLAHAPQILNKSTPTHPCARMSSMPCTSSCCRRSCSSICCKLSKMLRHCVSLMASAWPVSNIPFD